MELCGYQATIKLLRLV